MSLGLVEHLKDLADQIVEKIEPVQNAFFVDIGSNDGTLLEFFRQRGYRVLGIEPSHNMAEKARFSGIDVLLNYFSSNLADQIKKDRGPAAVVTANRVFANIDDLTDTIEGIRTLLAEDGVFIFETGYVVDLIDKILIDTIYHEHLGYDSVRPLTSFFHRNGMEMIDIQRIPIKGGSLRGTVQLTGGPRVVQPSVRENIAFEDSYGLGEVEPFQGLAKKISYQKMRLLELLKQLTSEGKVIGGYGASVGTTTLVHHLEIGDFLTFLVDDDPRHHNMYSPGHHLPVYSSDAVYERNPDYMIIFAWRYTEPIIERHREYLRKGGKFIVPYPEMTVISD